MDPARKNDGSSEREARESGDGRVETDSLDFDARFSWIVSARARVKRVHLHAIFEFIPKPVRLL
jgi:hypothetical protein